MDLRRYEPATLAAARRLRSSCCALAHGTVLIDRFLEADTVRALVEDHRTAGLDDVDVAVMDLAEKVAGDAARHSTGWAPNRTRSSPRSMPACETRSRSGARSPAPRRLTS
jgi:hypothetical protein